MEFVITSPKKTDTVTDVRQVRVPVPSGSITIWPNHAEYYGNTAPGELFIITGETEKRLVIKAGFCTVNENKVVIFQ